MKRCGYCAGWCMAPGACELTALETDFAPHSRTMERSARRCPRFKAYEPEEILRERSAHRRRDWKIGNPHDRQ